MLNPMFKAKIDLPFWVSRPADSKPSGSIPGIANVALENSFLSV